MTTIAVAGATGLVGRLVADALEDRSVTVVEIARSRGVDLTTGQGVDGALRGVDAVIDVSNIVTASASESVSFFTRATQNLLEAARRHSVSRLVILSIVGTDRVHSGYYAGKVAQERLVLESGLPTTILRATQFHEFAGQLLERFSLGPVSMVLNMPSRPVAAVEVADRLVDLALVPDRIPLEELAGPEVLTLQEMTRRLVRWRHERRLLVPLRLPGEGGRLMANGALLPHGEFVMGQQTFDEWLATQPRVRVRPT